MTLQAPAILPKLADIVSEHDEKRARLSDLAKELEQVARECEAAASIGGSYGGCIWGRYGKPGMVQAERALRSSAWRYVYRGLNIHRIAPASERDRFERELEDPPEFTVGNIRASFGDYIADPRLHILRGLAQQFASLDPAYKSHSKVKIGVKGLPKRVIVSGGAAQYAYHGRDRVSDIIGALRSTQGKPAVEVGALRTACDDARKGDVDLDGITLRGFQNGNMHIIFGEQAQVDINRALAEFYGDVLPDSPEGAPKKKTGTAVSADLAYYPTPQKVAAQAISDLHIRAGARVLEPSCGCGRIMDAVRADQPEAVLRGIEYDAGRAAQARAKGYSVQRANFLNVPPDPTFDLVIMNPPFCGRHWRKHLDHAIRFLAEKGQILAILPASAWYDGHLKGINGTWRDLPVASFAESGTNVPTGYFKAWRQQ